MVNRCGCFDAADGLPSEAAADFVGDPGAYLTGVLLFLVALARCYGKGLLAVHVSTKKGIGEVLGFPGFLWPDAKRAASWHRSTLPLWSPTPTVAGKGPSSRRVA